MKRQRPTPLPSSPGGGGNADAATALSLFDLLSEEIVFLVLDFLDRDPLDRKSFSLVCRSFRSLESRHRKLLRPLRSDHLPAALAGYPNVSALDLSLCPRVPDASLAAIAAACGDGLRSLDLSRSRFFSGAGLMSLAAGLAAVVGGATAVKGGKRRLTAAR